MKRRRIIVAIAVTIALGVEGRAIWLECDREQRRWESCANCRSFIHWDVSFYAKTNGGWYPRGAGSPLKSLALAVNSDTRVDNYTSHNQAQALVEHWKKYGELKEEHMCHRYVEGLNEKDGDHILMYFHRPTRYSSSVHPKQRQLGRPVMRAWLHWDFMPEAEFQEQLAKTLALVESRQTNNPSQ